MAGWMKSKKGDCMSCCTIKFHLQALVLTPHGELCVPQLLLQYFLDPDIIFKFYKELKGSDFFRFYRLHFMSLLLLCELFKLL